MSQGLYREVLIATLGTQPQVVTLAADLLKEDEHVLVDEVHVIHTAARGRIGEALEGLRGQFVHNRYRGRRCIYREVPIRTTDGQPVVDIRSKNDVRSAFNTIYHAVLEQKRAGRIVHLSIAGGRNSMVVYGAVTAQMLFDPEDRLWHIISTTAFERSGRMHRQARDEASLVPIPVLQWSAVSPVLTALVREQDPFRAVEAQEQLVEEQRDRQREEFLTEVLTAAEWRVLADYVTHSGTSRQIARRLNIAYRTVTTHLDHIYSKMRGFFPYDPSAVNRETLVREFVGFFEDHPELRSPPSD